MHKYGYQGKIQATPGNGDRLAEILLQAAQVVETCKGCHLYIVSKDPDQADTIMITEVWDSKEDHDNSLQLAEVRALIGQAMPILNGPPQKGKEFEVLGGAGIA